MKRIPLLLLPLLFACVCNAQLQLKDIFNRDLSGQRIKLVDWEGYMANPAIRLTVQAPAGTSFPLNVTVSANNPRLYFDLPSATGASGPSKTITLTNASPVAFFVSIFPDRDGVNETHSLSINSTLGTQSFPLDVLDQDTASNVNAYPVTVDFSQDKPAYALFSDPVKRAIVTQAATDWTYFISNMNLDDVPANNEYTFIWDDFFNSGYWVLNSQPYNGFLLYAYGAEETLHRSGGAPSLHAFQTVNGVATGLRRSGGYNADPHGNYNTLGWNTTLTDDTWYLGTNGGNVPNDLYSIALHEIGHALCFNPGYPAFQSFKNSGFLTDADVVAYQGAPVPINGADHLSNDNPDVSQFLVDRQSKRGPFGSEYAGVMPYGRWLITKLNLLSLKAVGYSLRQTSAFVLPAITTASLPGGATAQLYNAQLAATGGVPFYKFDVVSGTLPTGLTLNGFTGEIGGTPTQGGNYAFTVRLTDYDNKTFEKSFSIIISSVYTFTGNGDWNVAANWTNNQVPPNPVPAGSQVIVDPAPGGQCTFTGTLVLQTGATLTVRPGKVFHLNPQ